MSLVVGGALIGALASSATADEDTGSTTAHVGVQAGITMTGLTSQFTLSGTPGATVTGLGAVVFNVETNNVAGYAVTAQSVADVLSGTGSNTDSIAIGRLSVRESGQTVYTPLSEAAAVTVHSQSSRSADGGDDLSSDFQIRIPVVNEDVYTTTLDYVAATL